MTVNQEMKVNQAGRECRKWCAVDHSTENASGTCSTNLPDVYGKHYLAWADAMDDGYDPQPYVTAYAINRNLSPEKQGAYVRVKNSRDAEKLASFLEAISATPPGGIRALAARVRTAAEIAWEAE